ncbi:MAG: undecaprenyl-diphosphatase UppP [Patescibacteria group bacterium]
MNYIQAVILSIVEGVTEFLPVSSTGHLILTSFILKITQTEFIKSFEIFIQLGAIFSIVFLYKDTIFNKIAVWKKVLAAFIPTAIVGLILYKIIKHYLLGNAFVTVASLFIGGILFIIIEKIYQKKNAEITTIEKISYPKAVMVGVIQSLSVIPGVSRSGATIFGAMMLGVSREAAVEMSFWLAVPTLLAATSLDLVKSNFNFTLSEILLLSVGFIGSFITAYFTAKFLLNFIKKNNFIPFGIYRILLAILFWIVFLR